MIVVGIETSTPQTSVALGSDGSIVAEVTVAGKARQEAVAPVLAQLLRWTGADIRDVGGVAVGLGPGLFTGMRVGIETAKTLAQVLGVPIVGIGSLEVLAASVSISERTIVAVIDARRGEVFWAAFRPRLGGLEALTEPAVRDPDRLVEDLGTLPGELAIVGDGAVRYRDRFVPIEDRVAFAAPALSRPRAATLLELTMPRLAAGEHAELFDVAPVYLRRSDAEIAWDRTRRDAPSAR